MGRAPRPAVPRRRQRRRRRGAARRLRGAARGSRATRSPCTATTSTTRIRRAHDDSMLATNQRIWGYETNYGGLGELTVVKANQLMPKPAHLTWEEAAVNALTNSTSYRMLVSPNGAQMTQGQTVLIWGASGGIGALRVPVRAQRRRHAGRGRVEPRARRRSCARWASSTSSTARPRASASGGTTTPRTRPSGAGSASASASSPARDPDIVFEHPGRSTMGASVFVCTRGGTIITCAATTGFMIEYDNRYLWMNQKTLKGCHFANYREAWEANRLVVRGHDPSRALGGVPVRGGRPRRCSRCTTTSTRASSACSCSRPRRASASPTPRCASGTSPQITLFRRSA